MAGETGSRQSLQNDFPKLAAELGLHGNLCLCHDQKGIWEPGGQGHCSRFACPVLQSAPVKWTSHAGFLFLYNLLQIKVLNECICFLGPKLHPKILTLWVEKCSFEGSSLCSRVIAGIGAEQGN